MSHMPRDSHIPRLVSVIERTRLLEKLHRSVEHKLMLVCAPAGFGKTTAVAQFAHATPHTVIWHTFDEQERDFPILHEQITATANQILPGLDLNTAPSSFDPGELAASFTTHLRNRVEEELVIVLDDAHLIIGSSICETWLQTFVALLPVRCHIVLICRTPPPLPLTEMIARREIVAIGEEDLRFTEAEVDRLAQQVLGTHLEASLAEELSNRLQGWAAGIILALQPLPNEVQRLLPEHSTTPEALFDALANSMLDAQPRGLRKFLLASSTLARITPELATNVLRLSNSVGWLGDALERNLFLSRSTGGLTYHKLFRAFLQRQLCERDPDTFRELHLRAAEWFEAQNDLTQAFDHYISADAPEKASAAIDDVLHLYFAQSRAETLLQWNDALIRKGMWNARLLYFSAIIHIDRLNYEAATQELDRAEALFIAESNTERVAEIHLQRARMNLYNGFYLAAIAEAERLLDQPDSAANLKGRALRVIGFAYLRLGNSDLAVQYLEQAVPLGRENGDKLALSGLLQDLQIAYLRLGRLTDASACLQEVVALVRALGISSLLARALNDLGYHYHQHGDYAQAYAALQEGLSVVARIRNKRIESYLLWSLADLQRDRGSFDEAWQLYNRALEFTGNRDPNLRCNALIHASILRRWQNSLLEAQSLADEAIALTESHNLAIERLVAQGVYWAVRGLQGDAQLAFDQLIVIGRELQQNRAVSEAAHVLTLCADMSLLHDNLAAARRYLNGAVELIQQGASPQPVIAEILYSPRLLQIVLTSAAQYGGLSTRVQQLQSHRVSVSAVTRLDDRFADAYTYSLRVLTLGKEKIERDGVPILPGEWRATAARELFFYLLFKGAARREDISLAFWPDSSPPRVRSNFHTTLYRVRQALGENVIVFRDEEYMLHPDLDIWCDAHEFEKLVTRAQDLSLRDARAEDLFRRAVDLYQGELLPQLGEDWLSSYREQLSEQYLEALIGLGRCGQARHDFKQALNLFKQALKVDRYREDIHRQIMICFAEQGEKHKIYGQVQELKKLLWTELRVEPTKETLILAKTLLG